MQKYPYLNPSLVSQVIYLFELVFMTGINLLLLFPAFFKPFVIQKYPFFNFKTFIAIEITMMMFSALMGLEEFNNLLSLGNVIIMFISGLAFPYLWISLLRVGIIVLSGLKIREVSYAILANYTNLKIEAKQYQDQNK